MAGPDGFLTTYAPLANDIATQTGVDPSVVLGIVDVETGHGQHVLGNNIFGISPGGNVAQYPDVQTASQAFISLMQTPRYAGVAASPDPASQAMALVKSGYNTANPNYARLIGSSAAQIGKQLGYQDTAAPATQQPPPASSVKQQVLADPALQPPSADTTTPTTAPSQTPPVATTQAQPSIKDQVLADPALQPPKTETSTTDTKGQPAPTIGGTAVTGGGVAFPSEYGDLSAQPWAQGTPPASDTVAPSAKAFSSIEGMRNALQPESGYVRAPIPLLPFSFKETSPGSGQIDPSSGLSGLKFDLPAAIAPVVNPLLDFLEGTGWSDQGGNSPLAGKVSPAATALLLGAMAGNPLQQFRRPLETPAPGLLTSGDKQYGPPTSMPPSSGVFGVGGDLKAAPLSDDFKANPLTPDARTAVEAQTTPPAAPSTPTGVPVQAPPEPPPGTPTNAPAAPQSVGAAATPQLVAGLTPQEVALYQRTAEGQKLMEGQQTGIPDRTAYIDGITPNAAEQEQTASVAREMKALGIGNPAITDEMKQAAQDNAQKRTDFLADTVKAPADLDIEGRAREADIKTDKATVFAPDNVTGPVDHAPIVAKVNEILNDPENKQNDAVQSVIRPLLDRLQNADGTAAIPDPLEMWGLRRQIDRWTSQRSQASDDNLHYAAGQLGQVADVIDQQIGKVAPGYDDMLSTYAEHSRKMAEMRVLQAAEPGLKSGPGQTITFNAMQRFMARVVKARSTPGAVNDYQAITPETMDRLWALRDDLRRAANAKELGQASGSDTAQNIMDLLKQYTKMGGTAAAMGAAHHFAPVAGPLIVRGAQAIAAPFRAAREQRARTTRAQEMLYPPNPLINPNAPP